MSWAAPAALRETSSRPRATLFFSAGFFSLEKKRVQTSKTRFVHGDRGKILRFRYSRMKWVGSHFKRNFILFDLLRSNKSKQIYVLQNLYRCRHLKACRLYTNHHLNECKLESLYTKINFFLENTAAFGSSILLIFIWKTIL